MKLFNSIDIGDFVALGVIVGTIAKVLPALAAFLAVVYYGFVIYDRIRYGPELEDRMFNRMRKVKKTDETG